MTILSYDYSPVGGIPTPLKNDGVRQLGWLFHSQLKVIQNCGIKLVSNHSCTIYPLVIKDVPTHQPVLHGCCTAARPPDAQDPLDLEVANLLGPSRLLQPFHHQKMVMSWVFSLRKMVKQSGTTYENMGFNPSNNGDIYS